jgi:hypothetical protein
MEKVYKSRGALSRYAPHANLGLALPIYSLFILGTPLSWQIQLRRRLLPLPFSGTKVAAQRRGDTELQMAAKRKAGKWKTWKNQTVSVLVAPPIGWPGKIFEG